MEVLRSSFQILVLNQDSLRRYNDLFVLHVRFLFLFFVVRFHPVSGHDSTHYTVHHLLDSSLSSCPVTLVLAEVPPPLCTQPETPTSPVRR